MATASRPNNDIPADDELDAILNGTADGLDIFDTSNVQVQSQLSQPTKPPRAPRDDTGLGIDEEVKVVKKRQPIPKLDDNRLLSDPGIPKLRRISKERLKFKGKGHEYGDITRMLNMYQLWLDDLYPRAKFADGLTMIEKLGHSKRIQMMRKEWIDEGKPRHTAEYDHDLDDVAQRETTQQEPEQMEGVQANSIDNLNETKEIETSREDPDDDELDALLAESDAIPPTTSQQLNRTKETETPQEDPDEDELDALLAESNPIPLTSKINQPATEEDDPFADAMEAMAEMEDIW